MRWIDQKLLPQDSLTVVDAYDRALLRSVYLCHETSLRKSREMKSPLSCIFRLKSTPHPGPLLVRRGEGELFCETFSRSSPIASANTGLISVMPSAYLNSRQFVKFVSKVITDGHRHFAGKTFNPWAGSETDSRSGARDTCAPQPSIQKPKNVVSGNKTPTLSRE